MQAHDSNDQCSEAVNSDGRRDDAGSAVPPSGGVAHQEVPDAANRTVCLTANLSGNGGVSA